jgi:acyl carrier protein
MDPNPIYDAICARVLEIVQRKSPDLREIRLEARLLDELGLESLDIAELIATLELELGIDPFASRIPISRVRTVGDICDAYSTSLQA